MIASMDDMFSQMASQGWGGMEPDPEAMKAAEQQRLQAMLNEAAIADNFISTEAGQKFILWLAKATVLRGENEAEAGAVTAESYAIAKARRAGQNSIMFMIMNAVEAARQAKTGAKNEGV